MTSQRYHKSHRTKLVKFCCVWVQNVAWNCEILKVSFEISPSCFNPYTTRYVFNEGLKVWRIIWCLRFMTSKVLLHNLLCNKHQSASVYSIFIWNHIVIKLFINASTLKVIHPPAILRIAQKSISYTTRRMTWGKHYMKLQKVIQGTVWRHYVNTLCDDVMTWTLFLNYWSLRWESTDHRWFLYKESVIWSFVVFIISPTDVGANNRFAGDLRHSDARVT